MFSEQSDEKPSFVKLIDLIVGVKSNPSLKSELGEYVKKTMSKWKYFDDAFENIMRHFEYGSRDRAITACKFIDKVDVGSMESIAKECNINIIDKFDKNIHKDLAKSHIFCHLASECLKDKFLRGMWIEKTYTTKKIMGYLLNYVTITSETCTFYSINLSGTTHGEHVFEIVSDSGINNLVKTVIDSLFKNIKGCSTFKENKDNVVFDIPNDYLLQNILVMYDSAEWKRIKVNDISFENNIMKCFDVPIIKFNTLQSGVKKFYHTGLNYTDDIYLLTDARPLLLEYREGTYFTDAFFYLNAILYLIERKNIELKFGEETITIVKNRTAYSVSSTDATTGDVITKEYELMYTKYRFKDDDIIVTFTTQSGNKERSIKDMGLSLFELNVYRKHLW